MGLASHWPCVTDSSGLFTYGLNGREWEMSTPPTPQMGHGSLHLYLCNMNYCTNGRFKWYCGAVYVIIRSMQYSLRKSLRWLT